MNGVRSSPPFPASPPRASPSALPLYDFGPEAESGIQSTLPPEVVDPDGYTVLVPAVDADGNDVGRGAGADGRRTARHLHRLEPAGQGARRGRDARVHRQHHPLARNGIGTS